MNAHIQDRQHHLGCPCRVATRMLTHPGAPALELVEGQPEEAAVGAPILFVHGAFGGAWMWGEIFLPYFARRGRRSVALSLRGHGASEGRAQLRGTRLSDFQADVRRALREFHEPPVVVAHSLGGLLAQLLIGREDIRALVLLASLPPEGLMLESPRVALTDPHLWLEAALGSMIMDRLPIGMVAHQSLFSAGLPPAQVAHYSARMAPEAPLALAEAHLPHPVRSALRFGIPTLVTSGTHDRLVSRASGWRTALYHGAEHRFIEGIGHFPQLDLGAEMVAREVVDWMEKLGV